MKESRLDQLPFARQKLAYFYLSAAGTIFTPELSDARILWAKNGALTTVVDDFFDVGGSTEELENLVALVEMYDSHHLPPNESSMSYCHGFLVQFFSMVFTGGTSTTNLISTLNK